MDNVKKILKLDIISIYPYITLKNLMIFLGLGVFYLFISKNPSILLSMPLLFSLLFSSYPFLIGEEAGIDALYRIFSIRPKEVVRGRYLISIIIYLILSGVGLVLVMLSSYFIKITWEDILLSYMMYFSIYLLILSIQTPLYFKYDYKKAKTIAVFPLLGIGAIAFGAIYMASANSSLKEKLIAFFILIQNNLELTFISLVLFLLIGLLFSAKLSEKWYSQRDF